MDEATGPVRSELDLFRALLVARTLEEVCEEKLGHWYSARGEEGVTVGAFSTLSAQDLAVPHYRGSLAVFWLRGLDLRAVIAGLLGKEGFATSGRLSGLHAGPTELGVLPYFTNVIGPNLSAAVGQAWALKMRGVPGVVVAAMGDGTTGLGQFHECMNLSSLHRLPLVWVCQNNQYSISTQVRRTHAGESIAGWAAAYGMPSTKVDGNDLFAVREVVAAAVDRARAGAGPSFVEALTYRVGGHFNSDRADYRAEAETAEWLQRDPVAQASSRLQDSGADAGSLDALSEEVRRLVLTAWSEAAALPDAGVEHLGRSPFASHQETRP